MDVIGCVKMEAENTERKNAETLKELSKKRGEMDIVVVGGLTNSLVRHGKEGTRGFGGERVVRVGRTQLVGRRNGRYHII